MGAGVQIRKEPQEILEERREQARLASAAKFKAQEDKNDAKTKMKGKNKPSRKHKKKQSNIIEAKKVIHISLHCRKVYDTFCVGHDLQICSSKLYTGKCQQTWPAHCVPVLRWEVTVCKYQALNQA